MRNTQQTLTSLIRLFACGILALGAVAQAQDKKTDPSGTWTWTSPGRNDGPERKSTLKLKQEGEKLTGTVATTGRQAQANDIVIENAKVKGDEVSFTVTREFQGNKVAAKYTGKISGDTIKGKIETDRDGQTRSRDWEAKRETVKK